jgi:tetratricopeptide (TPR) repeat protein
MKGSLKEAIAILEEALTLCRARNIAGWSDSNAAALGYAYALSGRPLHGLSLLEEALRKSVYPALFSCWLSETLLLAGRHDEARARALRALDMSRQRRERGHEGYALRVFGEVAGQATPTELENAENAFRQALDLASTLTMRPLEAHCHLGLGRLNQRLGRRDEAALEFAAAAGLFHSMGMEFWVRKLLEVPAP